MFTHGIRRITTSVLILTLGSLGILNTSRISAARVATADNPKNDAMIVGQLTGTGTVTINDKKAINGTSIFTNSRIKVDCAKGGRAIVNLGRMGRIELDPGAQMTLRFSDGVISGDLTDGNIMINAAAGVKISIATSTGVAASNGTEAAVLPVKAQRGVRCVPLVVNNTSSAQTIGVFPLIPVLAGLGGAGVIGALAAKDNNDASNVVP